MDLQRQTPAPVAATLIALDGADPGRFQLNMLQFVGLVHCSDSEITMPSTALGTSRRHIRIEFLEGRFVMEDCNSTHGSFLNGEKISGKRVLAHGDVLAAGRARFRFELDALTSASSSTA